MTPEIQTYTKRDTEDLYGSWVNRVTQIVKVDVF